MSRLFPTNEQVGRENEERQENDSADGGYSLGVSTQSIKPAYFGSDTYAQDMNAYLSRAAWEDYKTRYQPIEDELIDHTLGTEMLNQRLSAISVNADTAFKSNFGSAERTRGRYGIQQNAQEKAAGARSRGLAKSTAIADAKNNTRTHIQDRKMEIIGGGAQTVNQAIRG